MNPIAKSTFSSLYAGLEWWGTFVCVYSAAATLALGSIFGGSHMLLAVWVVLDVAFCAEGLGTTSVVPISERAEEVASTVSECLLTDQWRWAARALARRSDAWPAEARGLRLVLWRALRPEQSAPVQRAMRGISNCRLNQP